jgi:DNA-binding MarR family transcriptional regulator
MPKTHDRRILKQEAALSSMLQIFPKIYYFIPRIEPFDVRVVHRGRLWGRDGSIEIDDSLAAILWLLDASLEDRNRSHCSQRELYDLVHHWSGWDRSRFTKLLYKLYAADLISGKDTNKDRRRKELTLTSKGKLVLNRVKNQRSNTVLPILEGLKLEDLEAILSSMKYFASRTWEKFTSKPRRKRPQKAKALRK